MIEHARRWAANGVPVFRCAPGSKVPMAGSSGFKDATTDLTVIERWWTEQPAANVAIPTGAASGIVVVDVDGDVGADSLDDLEATHGELPPTASVKTPSGGAHLYFRWPGVPVKPSASQLAPKLDIRGDGAYAVVPPSRTQLGAYVWDVELQPVAMPAWLVELTREPADDEHEATPPSVWLEMLEDGIPDGRRNVDLTRLTGHLLSRYVAVDVVAEIVHLFNTHRCIPPKPRSEVDGIIESIAGRELRRRERKSK